MQRLFWIVMRKILILEVFALGIEFKMTEGDFRFLEGKWSIEQLTKPRSEGSDFLQDKEEFKTILSYSLDVKPKLWLPVHLVEGRICNEIKTNLLCIRQEAQKVIHDDNVHAQSCS